ncbi:hypothetical protein SODG_002980 [Sodalis praecaptivus]
MKKAGLVLAVILSLSACAGGTAGEKTNSVLPMLSRISLKEKRPKVKYRVYMVYPTIMKNHPTASLGCITKTVI